MVQLMGRALETDYKKDQQRYRNVDITLMLIKWQ